MTGWTLYTRRSDGYIEAQIDDFTALEITHRYCDVGTWSLDLDHRAAGVPWLNRTGSGIYLVRDDTDVVLSGWTTEINRKRDNTQDAITFSGVDDTIWLAARRASPQPGTATAPYSTSAYDVRTGTASTVLRQYVDVNAGPGAVSARKVTWGGGLTLAADPAVGGSVTGRGRWQSLLELLQELALAGGVGFRVAHTGSAVQFQPFEPADKTGSVRFSVELGSLASHGYQATIPAVNHVYVGGGGEGTARTILERQDPHAIAAHGRREDFRDRRDTTDPTELAQAAQEHLDENKGTVTLTLTPVETGQLTYRADWDLGDKVTVDLDGQPITERIREIKQAWTGDEHTIRPLVGTPGATEMLRVFTAIDKANRRLTNLERI